MINGAISLKFGDNHSLKRYAPELLAGVIFNIYDQHTQIIIKLDVKMNKWQNTAFEFAFENQLKQNIFL